MTDILNTLNAVGAEMDRQDAVIIGMGINPRPGTRLEAHAAEHELIAIFGKLCDAVGYPEANYLFDKAGLNTDVEHNWSDVREAEALLADTRKGADR